MNGIRESVGDQMIDEDWLAVLSGEVMCEGAPTLPPVTVQVATTGRSGRPIMRDALVFKEFLKQILSHYSRPLSKETKILDFGCGWGRILRTFIHEVDAKKLLGVDAQSQMVEIASRTTGNDVSFFAISETPPIALSDAQFDLIYAYSVFSHLSEKTAANWVKEFARLCRPGGIIALTTRSRLHIEQVRKSASDPHSVQYREMFGEPASDLAKYDRGEFVFHPGKNAGLSSEHYGEAVVSERYARMHWVSNDLRFVGFFDAYSPTYMQPAIILQKD